MKIVADRYIPALEKAFDGAAEVVLYEPGAIDRHALHDCDVLLVRTVTRVDAGLLEGTPVRFVGTATSGSEHVDEAYLDRQGIGFASAAGCNARPVAEYVLSALSVLTEQRGCRLDDLSVAVIGCGHVGSQLSNMLQALGIECLLNDPPLQAAGDRRSFHELDKALEADVITLHVPLTNAGPYPTQRLLNSDRLAALRPGTIIINSARGDVIDERALKTLLAKHRVQLVADVWRNEPAIDTELAARAVIATPHIAGYSLEAKLRSTWRMRNAVAEFFDLTMPPLDEPLPAAIQTLPLDADNLDELARLAILTSYDIRSDATALQRLAVIEGNRSAYFSGLRHDYALRRELSALQLQLHGAAQAFAEPLQQLGFVCITEDNK